LPEDLTSNRATLIIPAYNEEGGLDVVLRRLAATPVAGLEVVVVDDGSTDDTAGIATRHGVRLVTHLQNRGKGAAVRSGLIAASTSKIVIMDADDTYPVASIQPLIGLLDTHEYVRGIRTIGRANIPPLNRFGNALVAFAIRVVTRKRSGDPLTGLYALRAADLGRMGLTSPGYGLETEIAIKSAWMRLRTAEIPIPYGPRQGESKLHPVRDGFVILGTLLGLVWVRLWNSSTLPQAE
jgi:glycosyltransferase involved in cell wall biosynthesis